MFLAMYIIKTVIDTLLEIEEAIADMVTNDMKSIKTYI
jgi:hypothetical protein